MKNACRLLEEAWTDGNQALHSEIMAGDAAGRPVPQMEMLQWREQYRDFVAVYKGIFLDSRFAIEERFASGDARKGVKSGGQLTISAATVTHHAASVEITEEWRCWDTHSLLESAAALRTFEQLLITT
jgi:hypothetical protein